jgi:signal recognition particle receptor subunit beta
MVIDSSDKERLTICRMELGKLLSHELLTQACLLVFANKQDLPNALSLADISTHLGLSEISNREWHIVPCCALTGEG